MASERVYAEEQFNSKNYPSEICFYAKMRLKNAPHKLKFLMSKALSEIYTQKSLKIFNNY